MTKERKYVSLREVIESEAEQKRHRWIGTAARILLTDGFEATQAFDLACKYAALHGPDGQGPFIEAKAIRHLLANDEEFPFG